MPELPEVETTRRSLAPSMEGKVFSQVRVNRPRMARRNVRPEDVVHRLEGRRLQRLGRRGKFMMGEVDGDFTLVVHLGMSGRFEIAGPEDEPAPHTNVVFVMDDGTEVRFVDPRTFGFVAVFTPEELAASTISALGRDALDDLPTARELAASFSRRRAAIKSVLLDQRVLAGLGNIYADEVLFRARIRPDRPADSLSAADVRRLRAAIGPVLVDGLAHGGTSLDDLAYLLPDGRAGGYLDRLAVYGRTDDPCRRCGRPIERMVLNARSSHFCPKCQT